MTNIIEGFVLEHKQVTRIDGGIFDDVYSCDNCGAHAGRPGDIAHFPTCRRGESKRWAKYYKEAP